MLQRKRYCVLNNLKIVPYSEAWSMQKELVSARMSNPDLEDVLLLLEHPAVYTLGTGSTVDFVKFEPQNEQYELHRTERGGEVTYHCPGQLVGYPILNLRYYQQDLHWYLRQLEAVIIQTMANYGLTAYRIPNLTGVWLEGKKIAALGIKVRRWITMHGFAVNVCPDMSGFQRIVPCGIADRPVGSLQEFVPEITMERVRVDVAQAFAEVFQVKLVEQSAREQVK